MIEKMEKIFICGLAGDASQLMRDIMKCGCLQISDPRQLEDCGEIPAFVDKHSSVLYDREQELSRISSAITALSPFIKSKGFLAQKPAVSFDQMGSSDSLAEALTLCGKVEALQKELSDLRAQLGRVNFQKDSLLPWNEYKVPLGKTETKTCTIRLMTLPAASDPDAIQKELETSGIAAVLYKVGSDKDQHFAVLLAYKNDFNAAEELVRQYGASRVSFSELSGTASEEIAQNTRHAKELEEAILSKENEFKALAERGDLLKLVFDSTATEIECKKAEQKLLHTRETCLLGAWIPVAKKPKVEKLLERYTCYYYYTKPETEEETPILLKNNKWIAPFESVTQMYSLPSSNSIDP
ncbi:MAG: hypothetical protein RR528_05710, partial [Angelakisella sp.]